jgi:CrcB protein
MQTFKFILAVFMGGGVGSLVRWGLNLWLTPYSEQFPAGTLAANVLSCFVVGLGVALANHTFWGSPLMRLLLITGFCGGFSTFSTLIRECYQFLETNRISGMLLYAVVSFVLGFVALLGGMWTGNRMLIG